MAPRLKTLYLDKIRPDLMKRFGYTSVMAAPRMEKITINMGVGEALQDRKVLDRAQGELARISGQKPVITHARKSVAAFKIREGFPIGTKVTLRRDRMYEFFDRLLSVALPRVRDFRGLSPKSFDGRGNYSLGLKEQIVFPEVEYEQLDAIRGMDITLTTTARSDEEARALLEGFRFPFRT